MSTTWPPILRQAHRAVRSRGIANRIARFVTGLSVRQRFLVEPVLGMFLLITLTLILMTEMGRQNNLLKRLGEQEITSVERYSRMSMDLETEHLALYGLVQDAGKFREVEMIDRSTAHLERLRKAVSNLEASLPAQDAAAAAPGFEASRIALRGSVKNYVQAATAAVTMATVDASLAARHLQRANEKFMFMNRAFGQVLDRERMALKTEIADQIQRGDVIRLVIALVGVVSAIVLLTLSHFLSKLLAKSLEGQIAALTALGAKAGSDTEFWGANEMDRIELSLCAFDGALTQLQRHDAEMTAKNQALADAMEALRVRNEELNTFSYTVSHDLRGPLRAINGFGAALADDYGPQLDTTATRYLDRIRAGTQRMSELIDDLLNLAKVSQAVLQPREFDLSAMARDIAGELQQRDPARQVEICIPDGIMARADEHLLRIAMENLIGNAWKYTGASNQARIQFGCFRSGAAPTYFIRDNGAGFDMQFADKLFTPFQRLHSDDQFPGSGIGLATVKRVMDRHGARIWAESRLGQGSTFSFSLGEGK